jgi:hypothetical protein
MPLTLQVQPETLAVCRLDAHAALPDWATGGSFFALTRTADELSVICAQVSVPQGITCEPDWRALKVEGQLDFAMVGVLAGISGALANARISLFAISTFDTDYILVKEADLPGAVSALRSAGYGVEGD